MLLKPVKISINSLTDRNIKLQKWSPSYQISSITSQASSGKVNFICSMPTLSWISNKLLNLTRAWMKRRNHKSLPSLSLLLCPSLWITDSVTLKDSLSSTFLKECPNSWRRVSELRVNYFQLPTCSKSRDTHPDNPFSVWLNQRIFKPLQGQPKFKNYTDLLRKRNLPSISPAEVKPLWMKLLSWTQHGKGMLLLSLRPSQSEFYKNAETISKILSFKV